MTKITVSNIRISVSGEDGDALLAAERRLRAAGVPFDKGTLHVYKKSVDARRKDKISFVYSVSCLSDAAPESVCGDGISAAAETELDIACGREKLDGRIYIVGLGPAGMFCGLLLAEHGYRPVIIERGDDVDRRVRKVEDFYKNGRLDPDTNIQFGAGGAGTFSDGKLVTRIGDGRTSYVLRKLHSLGAPEDILWRAKPHIGTDILRRVVKNTADEIVALGGEIRYNTKAERIGDGWIQIDGEKIPCGCVIVAPGHSSRDLYASLMADGYTIESKPFSVGVRIEHLQSELDRAMYGNSALADRLGHAEYQLSYRKGERGVYSFCMCPGGEVVAAASEEGGVVTNGMSRHDRNSGTANAAIAVSVLPSDFGGSADGAISFQRSLERAAYAAGGSDWSAPCQSVGNFFAERDGGYGDRIVPTYMNSKVAPADFNKLLPLFVSSMLKEGLRAFSKKIRGFASDDVPLTGIETRTSAPLRIIRDDRMCALGHSLVYPCGEGAGYAGGITSAAVDGIRVAEAVISRFSRD